MEPTYYDKVVEAHAILMPLAFAFFYPLGAILIRAISFRGSVWVHAGWMLLTYIMVLAGMGLGVWMAVVSDQIDEYHAIIGLVVTGALLIQPVTGLAHHLLYKRKAKANVATYPHVWWGRAVITLGIINGGFGLQLSGNVSRGTYIGYGIGAAVMWCLWMAVIVIAFVRSGGISRGETGGKAFGSDSDTNRSNRHLMENGHTEKDYSREPGNAQSIENGHSRGFENNQSREVGLPRAFGNGQSIQAGNGQYTPYVGRSTELP